MPTFQLFINSECYPSKVGASSFRPSGTSISITLVAISVTSVTALSLVLVAYNPFSDVDVYRVNDEDPDKYPFYCDTGLDNEAFDIWQIGIAS